MLERADLGARLDPRARLETFLPLGRPGVFAAGPYASAKQRMSQAAARSQLLGAKLSHATLALPMLEQAAGGTP